MCGISGYFCFTGQENSPAALWRMNKAIAHRGPDDEGYTLIRDGKADFRGTDTPASIPNLPMLDPGQSLPHQIALGHRRFSILDPGAQAHQPFWSPGRENCLIFNGEIYNYLELRSELEALGHRFLGHGDTEVLSAAYLEWGVECFQKCNGFWALVLYDTKRHSLLLARDRLGKAPLYWLRKDGRLWWSSEIKGIFAGIETSALTIHSETLLNFARTGSRDRREGTFYTDIHTFPSAAYAFVASDGTFQPIRYWSLPKHRNSESNWSSVDAISEFGQLLKDAVKLRLRSDVPVAIELSGGMDSSAIAALAAGLQSSPSKINAYTVTFPGRPEDETPYARELANAYSNQLSWFQVEYQPPDFFGRAGNYVAHMDEPFHSPNMISNQDLWKKMAAHGIKVSLNGGGGDEVLAGYASEYFGPYLVSLLRAGNIPRFLREFRGFSEHDREHILKSYAREIFHLLPVAWRVGLKPNQPKPANDPLREQNKGSASNSGLIAENKLDFGDPSDLNSRLLHNMGDGKMNYWMRSGNLSCMQIPTEVRLPFLDHRVVECAFRLPVAYLIREGWLKWILRKAMAGIVPMEILTREKKAGFPFPIRNWLTDAEPRFRSLAITLDCPYLDGKMLSENYRALTASHPQYLWRLLSIGMWWRRCVEGRKLNWE